MLRTLQRLFPTSRRRSGWSAHQVDCRTVDVFEPASEVRQGLVLFLQGHAQIGLMDNPVYCQQLQNHGLMAVCPHGGRSWWLDRICPEFSLRITPLSWLRTILVPWITEQWNIGPPRIALLGVSTGGAGGTAAGLPARPGLPGRRGGVACGGFPSVVRTGTSDR